MDTKKVKKEEEPDPFIFVCRWDHNTFILKQSQITEMTSWPKFVAWILDRDPL